jgi:hypothetical protein
MEDRAPDQCAILGAWSWTGFALVAFDRMVRTWTRPKTGVMERSGAVPCTTDLIGSPIEYVDETGTVSTPVHYDPYGNPRPGSADPVGIGYAGEWSDPGRTIRSYDADMRDGTKLWQQRSSWTRRRPRPPPG